MAADFNRSGCLTPAHDRLLDAIAEHLVETFLREVGTKQPSELDRLLQVEEPDAICEQQEAR